MPCDFANCPNEGNFSLKPSGWEASFCREHFKEVFNTIWWMNDRLEEEENLKPSEPDSFDGEYDFLGDP